MLRLAPHLPHAAVGVAPVGQRRLHLAAEDRPDAVVDPDFEHFSTNLDRMGELTGCDTGSWSGYLDAHRKRRDFFKGFGATSSDHGHPTADTANLTYAAAEALFNRIRHGAPDERERRLFRAQMLTEMAKMSLDDGRAGARSATTRPRRLPGSDATRASISRPAPTTSAG